MSDRRHNAIGAIALLCNEFPSWHDKCGPMGKSTAALDRPKGISHDHAFRTCRRRRQHRGDPSRRKPLSLLSEGCPDMNAFDVRPTLDAPDDDPYLWLEDVEGERALAWAAGQSAKTLKHFGGTQFERDRAALKAGLFPRRRRISPGRVAWLESDIRAWMETGPESRTA
ncbi:AlpA family phage regulatory protein [Mesorhizobium sp. M1E.F.Ca.ET.045.02.1.1]|nr:AlpA family phage regulatory protein [Mesorhizobium sp. M1E.F.Ca.ET.045.02.1.1]